MLVVIQCQEDYAISHIIFGTFDAIGTIFFVYAAMGHTYDQPP